MVSKCSLLLVVVVLLSMLGRNFAVDRSKFRTCADTGFCRRHRNSLGFGYKLDVNSVTQTSEGHLAGKITSTSEASLNLLVSVVGDSAIRVKITESDERYAPNTLLLPDAHKPKAFGMIKAGENILPDSLRSLPHTELIAISIGDERDSILAIHPTSLKFDLYYKGVLQASANARSLMHFEQSGARGSSRKLAETEEEEDRHGGKEVVDYWEDGLAIYADGTKEERRLDENRDTTSNDVEGDNFGGHKDSQPLGPKSVGMDFSFPFSQHVYGIPEHATSLSLPTTTTGSANIAPKYSEPFRLYNLDVFEYELDNSMALYGSIPLMIAHGLVQKKGRATGVFWFNPSETFVDISDESGSSSGMSSHKATRWISESGNVDFFFLPGPNVKDVYRQYSSLTGTQQLPPIFSLGYHQCRWNYRDQRDVAQVENMFEELDFPVDVIWLDIEHTNGKRYWTWDKSVFPDPVEMQKNLTAHGRRMVTIVDPHIKRDNNWATHNEATSLGYYIKDKHGKDYDGWCWPGSSSYLDFTVEKVRLWWQKQFSLAKYVGSTMDLFTWNDMNEPSVFNGPEVSMPKDTKNLEGVEHREWHNLYGIYMQMATALGLQNRQTVPVPIRGSLPSAPGSKSGEIIEAPEEEYQRPFVLSRAFWAGSQRWGAIWTGDNTASWGHLKIAAPMLLSINLAGLSFAGADVGGFFKDPSAELFTRWYQAGSFTPFFRGHAHLDTKRREPWVFGDPYTQILREVAVVRYSLLPFWYTLFYQAYSEGLPVMRTMFTEFPDNEGTYEMDDQWMLGSSLLVKPVTDEGATSIPILLPGKSDWYELKTLKSHASDESRAQTIAAPLDTIPVFIRGGSIIPRKMRLRRSSKLMFHDPLTLVVAPDSTTGKAEGMLYMDDEITMAHETTSSFAVQTLTFGQGVLRNVALKHDTHFAAENEVERIVIAGQTRAPTRIVLMMDGGAGEDLVFFHDSDRNVITIKKPGVKALENWTIVLEE